MPEYTAGQRVGNYEITGTLGVGGMGVVYRARDVRLGRQVAIKAASAAGMGGAAERERFQREARMASELNHPNIVTVYEIESADGLDLIVMELVDGRPLAELIPEGGLPLEEALDYATQIASGLNKAHAAGIVHRDLKPGNIMVTADGLVKILDFGLAKRFTQAEDELTRTAPLTETGLVMGTLSYMSPEQARGEAGLDSRSDIFSFGLIVYEMLAGVNPFRAVNPMATMHRIVNEPLPPLEAKRPGVPAGVVQLLQAALEKQRERRLASMAEALAALRALKAGQTVTITLPPAAEQRAGRKGRKGLIAALAAAALLLGPLAVPEARQWLARRLAEGAGSSAKRHVVLLPFTNVGNVSANEAICDGLQETLTSKLTSLENGQRTLWVVPASEVRRRKVADPEEARKIFGTTLAVTGSVQRDERGVRLTLNLIDAAELRQVGSAVLDNRLGDLNALEDAAIAKLVRMLGLEVDEASLRGLSRGANANPAAYENYLTAVGYIQRYDKAGNLDSAMKLLDGALKTDPNFALAYSSLGEAYRLKHSLDQNTGWLRKAEQFSTQAVKADPELAPAYITLGRIHDATGKPDLAVQEFQRALKLDPRNPEALIGLARTYERQGRAGEAEAIFKQAAALRPDYWDGYSSLGAFYLRQGKFREALPQYRKVVELTPDNSVGWLNLGALQFRLNLFSECRASIEKSLQLKPSYAGYSNLATLLYFELKFSDAAANYEKALKLNAADYRVWGGLGMAHRWSGDKERMRPALEKAVQLALNVVREKPNDARAQSLLATYYAELGDRRNTLARIESALAVGPDNVDALTQSAYAYEALGLRAKAVDCVKKAIQRGQTLEEMKRAPNLKAVLADAAFTTKR